MAGGGQHEYILVVDDDDDLRETMEVFLSLSGRTVVTAADGAQALQVLESRGGQPCVILLDLMMPVMDGFELLKHLGANPALAALPVVVLSGAGVLADTRSAEIPVQVLRKPVDGDTILAIIERFCPAPCSHN